MVSKETKKYERVDWIS